MSKAAATGTEPSSQLSSNNLITFLFRHFWWIAGFCLIAAVTSAVASLMIEEKFKSSVTMFASTTGSFGKLLTEEVNRDDMMEFGDKEKAEQLLQILNSDQIRDRIIKKYHLDKHYDIDLAERGSYTKLVKEYNSNINAELTRFGSIQVDVMDASPDTAMYIANDIAALADTVSNKLKNERASHAYAFATDQLAILNKEIVMWEDSIRTIALLGIFDYREQIAGINEQYATAILEGKGKQAAELKKQMEHISLYGQRYLSIKIILEELFDRRAVVRANAEKINIDRIADLPAKFVVDNAKVSDKKAYPVRWLIVVISTIAAFLFIVAALLLRDSFRQIKQ